MTTAAALAAVLLRGVSLVAGELAATLAPPREPPEDRLAVVTSRLDAMERRLDAVDEFAIDGNVARYALGCFLREALVHTGADAAEQAGTNVSMWGLSCTVDVARRALRRLDRSATAPPAESEGTAAPAETAEDGRSEPKGPAAPAKTAAPRA